MLWEMMGTGPVPNRQALEGKMLMKACRHLFAREWFGWVVYPESRGRSTWQVQRGLVDHCGARIVDRSSIEA